MTLVPRSAAATPSACWYCPQVGTASTRAPPSSSSDPLFPSPSCCYDMPALHCCYLTTLPPRPVRQCLPPRTPSSPHQFTATQQGLHTYIVAFAPLAQPTTASTFACSTPASVAIRLIVAGGWQLAHQRSAESMPGALWWRPHWHCSARCTGHTWSVSSTPAPAPSSSRTPRTHTELD